ncbi:solute carrier family 13 member 2-like [Mustelus asterias]
MLSCLTTLRNFRTFLILIVPLLLFLPLPIAVQTKEAYCGFIVLIMAVYWCTEVIPLAVTSFLPILLFPMFGIMPSKTVCMEYLQDTSVFFLGGLMVAIAIEHWNLHKRIALRALLLVGVKPAFLMLGFMGVTAFLSMWISNTASTTMMVPITQAVLHQLSNSKEEAENTELEKSHSSANDVDLETKCSSVDVGVSDDTALAEISKAPEENANLSVITTEPKDKQEKMNMYKGLTLCVCYAASIGGTATLTGTPANLILKGQMNQIYPDNGEVINFATWFGFSFPNMLIILFLCWIWLQILFLGRNFRALWGWGIPVSLEEERAHGIIQKEYTLLGPMSFAEKAVLTLFALLVILWFTREPGFVPGWGSVFDRNGTKYVSDATVALLIAVLMFMIPSQKPNFTPGNHNQESSKENLTVGNRPIKKLLNWTTVQRKLPWSVVLLLGGGFALAKGCEVSGLSRWLGYQLLPLQNIPHWAIVVTLCLVIAVFTECTSNVATATLFLPILASMVRL